MRSYTYNIDSQFLLVVFFTVFFLVLLFVFVVVFIIFPRFLAECFFMFFLYLCLLSRHKLHCFLSSLNLSSG